jgi:hypothetical protein
MCPSNALPLSCERPSAADRQLQRLVRRLSNQESEPRQPRLPFVCSVRPMTAHLPFLPAHKATPRSGLPSAPSQGSCHLSRSELHTECQVRRTPCRSAARAPHERFVDATPISLRRDRQSAATACSAASPDTHHGPALVQSIALTAPSHAVPGFSKEIVICNGETVVVPVKTHSPVPVRQWEPTAVPVSTTSKV